MEENLSPEQIALWDKEVEARVRYDEHAIVDLILLDLTSKYGISESQEQRLVPKILGAMQEMKNARSPRRYWYFSATERLLPLLSIQDPELQEIFTPDQWREFQGRDGNMLRQHLKNPQVRNPQPQVMIISGWSDLREKARSKTFK